MKHGARFDRLPSSSALRRFSVCGRCWCAGQRRVRGADETLANPFWGAMSQGVEGRGQEPASNFLQAAESDQAAEPQLNLCNTMLSVSRWR